MKDASDRVIFWGPAVPGAALIYLDNNASTPVDPRVRDILMESFSLSTVGNPHSEHFAGQRAHQVVEIARDRVAALLGVRSEEIIFTSGATESNNIVLKGLAHSQHGSPKRLIVSAIEHKSVLETALHLRHTGTDVVVLPVGRNGCVDLETLRKVLTPDTSLVSIMAANNEVGVIQPLAEIAALCSEHGVPFHTDAAQAIGKISFDASALGVDFVSFSAHKLYGPIGIGALFMSGLNPAVPEPLTFGGGQERGYRAGTVSPALTAALGTACVFAREQLAEEADRVADLKARLLRRLNDAGVDARELLVSSPRLPGLLSLWLPGIDAARLVGAVQPDLAISTHSACSSGTIGPSHVLMALGMSPEAAASTLRIGIGRFNSAEDIDQAALLLATAVRRQTC